MNNLAQYLQERLQDENIMERAMNEIMRKEYSISNDIEISYSLINTAQQTLSDLDKSIDEARLVYIIIIILCIVFYLLFICFNIKIIHRYLYGMVCYDPKQKENNYICSIYFNMFSNNCSYNCIFYCKC